MAAEFQFPAKLEPLRNPSRYKVFHGGRGGAKSWGFARSLLLQGLEQPLRILCAREVQKSIKDSVHKLLSDQVQAMGLGAFYEVLQTEIRGVNGTEFLFAGLSNQTAESIKSYEGIDRCWIEEGQGVTRRSWDILTPTIRKEGSEIWVSMNPDLDTDETYQRFIVAPPPDAVIVQVNHDDNPWFPNVLEKERLEMLRQVKLGLRSQSDYDNIWRGACKTSVDGAIYANEVRAMIESGRVRSVPYDPMLKVHTVWDLGWNDSMFISLVQRAGSEIRVIHCIEDSHKTYAEYVQELAKMPYVWGKDFLPHDGNAKTPQTGLSAKQILAQLGRNVDDTGVPNIGIEDGIKATRLMFPRVYMNAETTRPLLGALKRYKRNIPVTTGEPGSPTHDGASHGADNFRYIALCAEQMRNEGINTSQIYAGFKGNWRG
jgi:phage terminase large subunit